MRQLAKTLGAAAFAFGAGALMGLVLPPVALAFIEAALIVGAGAALFIKKGAFVYEDNLLPSAEILKAAFQVIRRKRLTRRENGDIILSTGRVKAHSSSAARTGS